LLTGIKLSLSDILSKNVDYGKGILEDINSVIKKELRGPSYIFSGST
jgi:hypothetical protein